MEQIGQTKALELRTVTTDYPVRLPLLRLVILLQVVEIYSRELPTNLSIWGLCKSKIFSQSTQRTRSKESILSANSANSALSVRDIFFAFTQSH